MQERENSVIVICDVTTGCSLEITLSIAVKAFAVRVALVQKPFSYSTYFSEYRRTLESRASQ